MGTIRTDIPAVINPGEAIAKANRLKALGQHVADLLKQTKEGMDLINDQEAGILFGSAKNSASTIRDNLDTISGEFGRINGQIPKTADDIIAIATTMENE